MSTKLPEGITEEVNCVGGGAIAGVGIGPDGEPGVSKARQKAVVLLKARTMKRFKDAVDAKK